MKMYSKEQEFKHNNKKYKARFEFDGTIIQGWIGCYIKEKCWYGWRRVWQNPHLTIGPNAPLTWGPERFDEHLNDTIKLFKEYLEKWNKVK